MSSEPLLGLSIGVHIGGDAVLDGLFRGLVVAFALKLKVEPALERDAQKAPGMAHPNRSIQGRTNETEITETVATTLENPDPVGFRRACHV